MSQGYYCPRKSLNRGILDPNPNVFNGLEQMIKSVSRSL